MLVFFSPITIYIADVIVCHETASREPPTSEEVEDGCFRVRHQEEVSEREAGQEGNITVWIRR